MKLIKLTQGMFVKVDDVDYERTNQHNWYFSGKVRFGSSTQTIWMQREINNTPTDMFSRTNADEDWGLSPDPKNDPNYGLGQ